MFEKYVMQANVFLLAIGGIVMAETLRFLLSGGAVLFGAGRIIVSVAFVAAVLLWVAGRIDAALVAVAVAKELLARPP